MGFGSRGKGALVVVVKGFGSGGKGALAVEVKELWQWR